MTKIKVAAAFSLALAVLVGCGGGSKSGAGERYDGFYEGIERLNIEGIGNVVLNNITINIKDGDATVRDGTRISWRGRVNAGGDFRADRDLGACDGESRYQGQVSGQIITGSFREVGSCIDDDVVGTFRAERVGSPRREARREAPAHAGGSKKK